MGTPVVVRSLRDATILTGVILTSELDDCLKLTRLCFLGHIKFISSFKIKVKSNLRSLANISLQHFPTHHFFILKQ